MARHDGKPPQDRVRNACHRAARPHTDSRSPAVNRVSYSCQLFVAVIRGSESRAADRQAADRQAGRTGAPQGRACGDRSGQADPRGQTAQTMQGRRACTSVCRKYHIGESFTGLCGSVRRPRNHRPAQSEESVTDILIWRSGPRNSKNTRDPIRRVPAGGIPDAPARNRIAPPAGTARRHRNAMTGLPGQPDRAIDGARPPRTRGGRHPRSSSTCPCSSESSSATASAP
mgnify:CR=1 FL=1